jgi:hypothetical protein
MPGSTLADLLERRSFACRLTPERALKSLADAARFLCDRGLLTRTEDSALPSLFTACHEPPYAAGRGGFAEWPATKYPWFGELAGRDSVYELRVHGGKSVLLTAATAALADPVCRSELERHSHGNEAAAQLLRLLAEAGPSALEDLKLELEWTAARMRSVRAALERAGALVSRSTTFTTGGGSHVHSSVLARWDQVFQAPSATGGLGDLLVAGVRAAVVAPEDELERWFSWDARGLAERLIAAGRLERPAAGWVSAVSSSAAPQ